MGLFLKIPDTGMMLVDLVHPLFFPVSGVYLLCRAGSICQLNTNVSQRHQAILRIFDTALLFLVKDFTSIVKAFIIYDWL